MPQGDKKLKKPDRKSKPVRGDQQKLRKGSGCPPIDQYPRARRTDHRSHAPITGHCACADLIIKPTIAKKVAAGNANLVLPAPSLARAATLLPSSMPPPPRIIIDDTQPFLRLAGAYQEDHCSYRADHGRARVQRWRWSTHGLVGGGRRWQAQASEGEPAGVI
jgi:hypothetical protein